MTQGEPVSKGWRRSLPCFILSLHLFEQNLEEKIQRGKKAWQHLFGVFPFSCSNDATSGKDKTALKL